MEIEYVDEEFKIEYVYEVDDEEPFDEKVIDDIEELPKKGKCSYASGIFNLDLIEKSRPPPRPIERREPKEYTGKLTQHPSKLIFGTYEDHLAYSTAWSKVHGSI